MWCIIAILVIFIVLFFVIIIQYLSWNFEYWKKRQIRGPKPQLLWGTFPKASAGKCNLIEELDEIYRTYKGTEKYVGVFAARSPKLFILDPKLAKEILTTHFKYFHDNESSKWTTPSVEQLRICSPFVSTGETWKEKRSEMAPILTASRLRTVHSSLIESAHKLVDYIGNHLNELLDAKELINRYTADFMANFIWSIQTETNAFVDGTHSDVHKMANAMIEQAMNCVRHYGRTANWPWLRRVFPVRFFPANSDHFFKQLAMYAMKKRTEMQTEEDHSSGGDVINHLIQLRNRKSLNDVQIAGHTTTMLIDGFETGAIVTAHCLLLLSRNTRVQQKLRDELCSMVADWSYDALNNLEYLDQCVNETLRLFPPLTTLFKLCTETVMLDRDAGTSFALEPGVGVYISTYSFQRDAEYYEQPETFWPERFSPQMGGVRKYQEMSVFLPFGDGPRICPGMKLGLAETKAAVANIVRNFHIKSNPTTRLDNKIATDSFLLTLDGGIQLIFEKL